MTKKKSYGQGLNGNNRSSILEELGPHEVQLLPYFGRIGPHEAQLLLPTFKYVVFIFYFFGENMLFLNIFLIINCILID